MIKDLYSLMDIQNIIVPSQISNRRTELNEIDRIFLQYRKDQKQKKYIEAIAQFFQVQLSPEVKQFLIRTASIYQIKGPFTIWGAARIADFYHIWPIMKKYPLFPLGHSPNGTGFLLDITSGIIIALSPEKLGQYARRVAGDKSPPVFLTKLTLAGLVYLNQLLRLQFSYPRIARNKKLRTRYLRTIQDAFGWTLTKLRCAVSTGLVDFLELCLEQDHTSFESLQSQESAKGLAVLLKHNYSADTGKYGYSEDIVRAVEKRRANVVEAYLKICGEDSDRGKKLSREMLFALNNAIKKNHKKMAELIVSSGIPLDFQGEDQVSPLYRAVVDMNEMVPAIIRAGADLHHWSQGNWTPLRKAISLGNIEMVKLLIKYGVDVNNGKERNFSALYWALKEKKTAIARILLEAGADLEFKTGEDSRPILMAAVEHENKEFVQLLLEFGADVNAKNEFGWSSWMLAIKEKKLTMMDLLIEAGADQTIIDQSMIEAGGKHDCAGVSAAVEKGVDVNNLSLWGRSALMNCGIKGCISCVERLIEAGSNIHQRTSSGFSTLDWAALSPDYGPNHFRIIKILLAHGAKIDGGKKLTNPPLVNAVQDHNSELFDLLLEHGADIEISNRYGQTPLIKAVIKGNLYMAQKLIKAGADTSKRTRDYNNLMKNALASGVSTNKAEMVEFLEQSGCAPEKAKRFWLDIVQGFYQLADSLEVVLSKIQKIIEKPGYEKKDYGDFWKPLIYFATSKNRPDLLDLLKKKIKSELGRTIAGEDKTLSAQEFWNEIYGSVETQQWQDLVELAKQNNLTAPY